MKTMNPKRPLVCVLLLILFSSCLKEDISRNTVFLVQHSWRFDMYGLDENNNGIIEEWENSMMPCEVDDRFTFLVSGSGFFERDKLSCSPSEPDIINFSWSFYNKETELAIFASPEKISRLDDNILEVYYMDVNSLGHPVRFIRRFRH
ncbi:MAG TPA: hypothetical protein VFP97_15365 [Chitinophagaceae bacterium]|nr:hypothetical protein [Chitinophagaceae bacterium]